MGNLAYEVNGELVVRVSKESDPTRRAELIEAETELLAAVTDISPLPVPEPLFIHPRAGFWAYAKIPGVPLLDLPFCRNSWPALQRLLPCWAGSSLLCTPLTQVAQLADQDEVPMAEWRD